MKNSKAYKIVTILLFFFAVTGGLFFDCAKPNQVSPLDENSASTAQQLTAFVVPASFAVGTSAQVVASGGTPPYTYVLDTANGTIDQVTGVLSQQSVAGNLQVEVHDTAGSVALTSAQVISGGGGNSCTYNGQTIQDGGTTTGYSASSASCGGSCQSATLTCGNGVLTGASVYPYASCTAIACQWVGTATSCATPSVWAPPVASAGNPCTDNTQMCVGTTSQTSTFTYGVGYTNQTVDSTTGAIYICQ